MLNLPRIAVTSSGLVPSWIKLRLRVRGGFHASHLRQYDGGQAAFCPWLTTDVEGGPFSAFYQSKLPVMFLCVRLTQ